MNIAEKLKKVIGEIAQGMNAGDVSFGLDHPTELSHGDYATNIAMVLSKQLGKNPRAIAEEIAEELRKKDIPEIEKVEIAGPGFINVTLSKKFFETAIPEIVSAKENFGRNKLLAGKKVMIEYTQPNPFKPFHIGHLMSNSIGESLSRIIDFSGAYLIRVNYQGDVGLHVAKAIYGIEKKGRPEATLSVSAQAQYIGECYSWGSDQYENDPEAKPEIDRINKAVYERTDMNINGIYDWGRKLTLEAFEDIYKILGTHFEDYFFESGAAVIGKEMVLKNIETGIFEKSEGAIVFPAEKYGPKLHTRVFITSQGLPTYDAKEIGLAKMKFEKEPGLDISITTTAVEQLGVIRVAYEAIYQVWPDMRGKLKHVTHGMMRLSTGKMSSRKGNVVTGESLINDSRQVAFEKMSEREGLDKSAIQELATIIGVGALKYSILKSSPGSDVVYDFEKSISFDGDSGPYLQYTYARIASLLAKASKEGFIVKYHIQEATDLERVLYRLPEIVEKVLSEYAPNHLATYLIDVAREFNSFYASNKIIDPENKELSAHRLALASATGQILKNGLWLLGISAPDRM